MWGTYWEYLWRSKGVSIWDSILGSICRPSSETSGNHSGEDTQDPPEKLACNIMAFSRGTIVTGGYRSCPAMQRGTTVTTGVTAIKTTT